MATRLVLRVRLRTADNTADALVFGSATDVPGAGICALQSAPGGDGTAIDPMTGAVTVGSTTVTLLDVETAPGVRVLTSALNDAGGRLQWIGRHAFVEIRELPLDTVPTDGPWEAITSGFVTGLKLTGALPWSIAIGDSRRTELRAKAFAPKILGSTTQFAADGSPLLVTEPMANYFARWPHRGTLVGGGITGPTTALGGVIPPPSILPWARQIGGWEATVGTITNGLAVLRLDAGWGPSGFGRSTDADTLVTVGGRGSRDQGTVQQTAGTDLAGFIDTIITYDPCIAVLTPFNEPNATAADTWATPFDRYPFDPYNTATVDSTGAATPMGVVVRNLPPQWPGRSSTGGRPVALVRADQAPTGFLTNGGRIRFSAVTKLPTPRSPLYWSGHPTDLYAKLCDEAGVVYDPDSVAAARAAINAKAGVDLRITLRITGTPVLADFLQAAVFTPFQLSVRPRSSSGAGWELIPIGVATLRALGQPTVTLDADALTDDAPGDLYDVDDSAIVTSVVLTGDRYVPWPSAAPPDQAPPDGIAVQSEQVTRITADPLITGPKPLSVTVPGMIHDSTGAYQLSAQTTALALEVAARSGRGLRKAAVTVTRGTPAHGAKLGDLLTVDLPHLPNDNRRLRDDPANAAPREMQIVKRTPNATSADLILADAAVDAPIPAVQPDLIVTPVTTITASVGGTPGANGTSDVYRYLRSDTPPAAPFGDPGAPWVSYLPGGTGPLWRTTAQVDAGTGAWIVSDADENAAYAAGTPLRWSTPGLVGAPGAPGANGTTLVRRYLRSLTAPATPYGDPGAPWSPTIPADNGQPLYETEAAVDVVTGTFIVPEGNAPAGRWRTPVQITAMAGTNGYYLDTRYYRADTNPGTPFGDPTNWVTDPSQAQGVGLFLWVTQALRVAGTGAFVVAEGGAPAGRWSAPTQWTGPQGPPGPAAASPFAAAALTFADGDDGFTITRTLLPAYADASVTGTFSPNIAGISTTNLGSVPNGDFVAVSGYVLYSAPASGRSQHVAHATLRATDPSGGLIGTQLLSAPYYSSAPGAGTV